MLTLEFFLQNKRRRNAIMPVMYCEDDDNYSAFVWLYSHKYGIHQFIWKANIKIGIIQCLPDIGLHLESIVKG